MRLVKAFTTLRWLVVGLAIRTVVAGESIVQRGWGWGAHTLGHSAFAGEKTSSNFALAAHKPADPHLAPPDLLGGRQHRAAHGSCCGWIIVRRRARDSSHAL